tara:strand:+ start:358 stop:621 length:264 start_codon:yes stop_codon:yes gene_type:complete
MLKKIRNIIFITSFLIFVILITIYYFSEQNILITNKTRSINLVEKNNNITNLPVLENDTKNIIVYSDEVESFIKDKKKYFFWKLLEK